MIQYCNVPLASPVKFIKNTSTPPPGFDGDWFVRQILPFQRNLNYQQKWQVGDSTSVQITSTIPPSPIKVYDCQGNVLFTLAWTSVLTYSGASVYECALNLDAAVNKIVYLYFEATMMATSFKWVSEPIYVKTTWPLTNLFKYYHFENVQDVVFTTGYRPIFRCEADILDANFLHESYDFVDEIHDTKLLSGTPYREFKLDIGTAPGVAPWVVDILNRIFCFSHVEVKGLQYAKVSGAKWDINRVKGYPLIGASMDITEAKNLFSNQQNVNTIEPGIVTGWMFSPFFGTATNIEVLQIEKIN